MIQFLKNVYLTCFAVFFRRARVKRIGMKVGYSIAPLVLLQYLVLLGISGYVEILTGHRVKLPKAAVIGVYVALLCLNLHFLATRGRGIKFAHDFGNLKKRERITLTISCAVVFFAGIVFFIFAAIAHDRFINTHK